MLGRFLFFTIATTHIVHIFFKLASRCETIVAIAFGPEMPQPEIVEFLGRYV